MSLQDVIRYIHVPPCKVVPVSIVNYSRLYGSRKQACAHCGCCWLDTPVKQPIYKYIYIYIAVIKMVMTWDHLFIISVCFFDRIYNVYWVMF